MPTAHRATVLVVDDTPQNIELLVECLSPYYRTKIATGGERALAICAQEAPDLVILDVMMPDMDGFETLRRLKALPAMRPVPVIFATAKGDKTDEQLGLEMGAADYIAKPIHVPVLLSRVKTHIALYEHQRNLETLVRERTSELSGALQRIEKDGQRLRSSLAQLAFERNHDQLTGLSNRRFMMQRLGELMRDALLQHGQVGLAAINLDRFRAINLALGVAVGDAVLIGLAQRLLSQIRPDELLARLGGDQFVLLIPGGTGIADLANDRIEKLLGGIREPLVAQGNPVELTASVGLAVFPADGATPSELLRCAELALGAAKRAGRNRSMRFLPAWALGDAQRFEQELQLRRAIADKRIEPYYQPKVNAITGALEGAEALMRWPRDDGGFYSPGEFVPLAEDCGLMESLDDLVIVAVLHQLAAWRSKLPKGFRVAVNISSNRFHDGRLPERIREWLKETGALAEHLELEITEGALIGDTQACAEQLGQLRELGIELTLDDFGTGYSSLSYLKRLPLQHLKIDQSFVRDIATSSNDSAIVRAVVALAGALNLHTIAEGVETQAQLEFVQNLGCHTVQGFLFSPAIDAVAFSKLLDAGRIEK